MRLRRRRLAREEARVAILGAANRHRLRRGDSGTPYLTRHLQRAVHVCRQNRLVSPDVLEAAGFRAKRRA